MNFVNRGFTLDKKTNHPLSESYANTDFEFSREFKEWFFNPTEKEKYVDEFDKWQKVSTYNYKKVNYVIRKVLKKWQLPKRYHEAIRELILFNRIIPALSGIEWISLPQNDGTVKEGLCWDADTTKEDIYETIEQDDYGIFKNKSHFLKGRKRNPERKSADTNKMVEHYNYCIKRGYDSEAAYNNVQKVLFPKLSISAIKKRINKK
jgi:hypothetical protein